MSCLHSSTQSVSVTISKLRNIKTTLDQQLKVNNMNPSLDDPERMCADYAHELPLIPGAFQIHQRPAGRLPDWGRRPQQQRQPQGPRPIVTRQTIERLNLERQSTPNMMSEEYIDASVELLPQRDDQSQTSTKSSSRFAVLTKKLGKRDREDTRLNLLSRLRKKLRRSSLSGSHSGDTKADESFTSSEPNSSTCERDSRLDINPITTDAAPISRHPVQPAARVSLTSSEGGISNGNAIGNSVSQVMEIFPDANRALVEAMLWQGKPVQVVLCFFAEQSELTEFETAGPAIAGVPQVREELRTTRIMEVFPDAQEDTVRELLESGESVDQVMEDLIL